MSLASIAPQMLQFAKKNRLASRGLNSLSRQVKNKTLAKAFGIGGKIAGALGFARAMGVTDGAPPGGVSRAGGSKRTRSKRNKKNAAMAGNPTSGVVTASDAPVAFARTDQLRPLFRAYPTICGDGLIVHTVEPVSQVTFSATAGNFAVPLMVTANPQNANLQPWLSTLAPLFARWKPKFMRLHYQHFCGTQVAGQVMLSFVPNPSWNNTSPTGVTYAILSQMSNFTTGAVYEDFFHNVDLSAIDPTQWFDTGRTAPTDESNANACGLILVSTLNAAASQPATGNFWFEAVYEFNSRNSDAVTVGMRDLGNLLSSDLVREEKLRVAQNIVLAILKQKEEKQRAAKVKQSAALLTELDSKYALPSFGTTTAGDTSSVGVKSSQVLSGF